MTKIKHRLLLTQSDQRLACMVQAGHEPAFEALVHRYRRPLLRYCRRLCLSEARAEEALQQALLNAWVALRKETEVRDLRAWLYRVARNAALNAMRGEQQPVSWSQRALEEGLETGGAGAPTSPSPSIEDRLALRDALAGIAALPEMQREVMVRAAVAGHSHQEVASALGISDDAVRGLLYRARSTLRDGFTAITPASLLAWAARGAEGGADTGTQRIAELAAGGGTAGLAGLAAKGGAVAITAGIAITGVVVGHPRHAAPSGRALLGAASPRESAQAAPSRPPTRVYEPGSTRTGGAPARPESGGARGARQQRLRGRRSYAFPAGGAKSRHTVPALVSVQTPGAQTGSRQAAGGGAAGPRPWRQAAGGGHGGDASRALAPGRLEAASPRGTRGSGDGGVQAEPHGGREGGQGQPGAPSQAGAGEAQGKAREEREGSRGQRGQRSQAGAGEDRGEAGRSDHGEREGIRESTEQPPESLASQGSNRWSRSHLAEPHGDEGPTRSPEGRAEVQD